ncbi:putative tail fiber protein [Xanthomonas phage Pfeifenkraut]|uniref:Tail fiber protein n=1 Tax=Xanthomonas phage Pfeifenkraut TaxID=2939132 RepID=A0A9E7E1P4_9CAUD|nr:putative tail fiber protein [Xanthomonas phage Pfeifenkraut]URA06909.1 putative tail fiber protein [Xanthomonas phage Pfeifenkraut]
MNAQLKPDAHVHIGLNGRFRFQITKADADGNPIPGTTRDCGIEPGNLITNVGLNNIGIVSPSSANNGFYGVAVGSGTATPSPTDTTLQTQVAITTTLYDPGNPVGNSYQIDYQSATSPRYYRFWKKWRFAAGAAAGNLTEVGVMTGSSPVNTWCRALIVDGAGNPITLTVLSDEILDVTYELRVYIPENDVTGTIVLKGVTYDWLLRPCSIGRQTDGYITAWPGVSLGSFQSQGPRAKLVTGLNSSGSLSAVAAAATLQPIDGHPITNQNPTSRGADSLPTPTYVSGSFQMDTSAVWGLTVGNNAALNMLTLSSGIGSFQIWFDGDTFSKNNTEKMTFTLRVSWGNYTP